jgi:hypothetical protein
MPGFAQGPGPPFSRPAPGPAEDNMGDDQDKIDRDKEELHAQQELVWRAQQELKKIHERAQVPEIRYGPGGKELMRRGRLLGRKIAFAKKRIVKLAKKAEVELLPETVVVTYQGPVVPFDSERFRSIFRGSVERWGTRSVGALSTVRDFMTARDTPSGLSLSEVVGVFAIFTAGGGYLSSALTVLGAAEKLFEGGVGGGASLNRIHDAWERAMDKVGSDSAIETAYLRFVDEWKKREGLPAEQDRIGEEFFIPALTEYGTKHLPGKDAIKRAFMKEIIEKTAIGPDSTRGKVIVSMRIFGDVGEDPTFGAWDVSVSGMDDASEDAIRTLWSGHRLIELPLRLRYVIERVSGADVGIIERKAAKANDTSFSLVDGEAQLLEDFRKREADWGRYGVWHIGTL